MPKPGAAGRSRHGVMHGVGLHTAVGRLEVEPAQQILQRRAPVSRARAQVRYRIEVPVQRRQPGGDAGLIPALAAKCLLAMRCASRNRGEAAAADANGIDTRIRRARIAAQAETSEDRRDILVEALRELVRAQLDLRRGQGHAYRLEELTGLSRRGPVA